MPISFEFDRDNLIMREQAVGEITMADFVDNVDRFAEVLPQGCAVRVVSDYRQAQGQISAEQISAMKEAANAMLEKRNATARTAVVVAKQLFYGLGRMYSMVEDSDAFEVRIFTDMVEAEAWLGIR